MAAPKKKTPGERIRDELRQRLSGESMRFLPEAWPRPHSPAPPVDERERAQWQNEYYDWYMRGLIFQAVHTNDPDARATLAQTVSRHHFVGSHPLPRPVREWLAWVLTRLVATDSVPHLARGNAIKGRERFDTTMQLAKLVGPPSKGVTARLADAAKALRISPAKASKLYYSALCQSYLECVELGNNTPPIK